MHHGLKPPKFMFSTFYGETWFSLKPEMIKSGFRREGIFPFNWDVISPDKYGSQSWKW
jgi:hypothetical protein